MSENLENILQQEDQKELPAELPEKTAESMEGGWVAKNAAEYVRREEEYAKLREKISEEEEIMNKERDSFNERFRSNPFNEHMEVDRLKLIQQIDAIAGHRTDLEKFRNNMESLQSDPEAITAKKNAEDAIGSFLKIQEQWRNENYGSENYNSLSQSLLEAGIKKDELLRRTGELSFQSGERRGEFWDHVSGIRQANRVNRLQV